MSSTLMRGLPWWLWIPLGHGFFLFCLYWLLTRVGVWNDHVFQHMSLLRENNLAVWWAGVCLIIAAFKFYELGSDSKRVSDRVMWIGLALIVGGLCMDEIGSLHERVSLLGGWWALLPFGIVGGSVFVYAIGRCLMVADYRITGVLILTGLCLFVVVAGLEHLGGVSANRDNTFFRFRLLIEEGAELIGSTCLIVAALLAQPHKPKRRWFNQSVLIDPPRLLAAQEILYVGLMVHLAIAILAMPWLWDPERGNPVYWYPMMVFLLCGFHCMCRFNESREVRWLVGVGVFVLLSMGQMQNIGTLALELVGMNPNALVTDRQMIVGWSLLPTIGFLFLRGVSKSLVAGVALLLCLLLLIRNGEQYFETYYILSGVLALMSFNQLIRNHVSNQNSL